MIQPVWPVKDFTRIQINVHNPWFTNKFHLVYHCYDASPKFLYFFFFPQVLMWKMCRAAETGKLQVLQRVPCNGKQNGRTQCRLGWCWAVLDSAPMVWSLLPQPCHTPDSLSAVPIAVWSQCSWRNSRPVSSLAVDLVKLMVCCSAHMYLEPISFEQRFYLTMSKTDFIWIQTKSVIVSASNWIELA